MAAFRYSFRLAAWAGLAVGAAAVGVVAAGAAVEAVALADSVVAEGSEVVVAGRAGDENLEP